MDATILRKMSWCALKSSRIEGEDEPNKMAPATRTKVLAEPKPALACGKTYPGGRTMVVPQGGRPPMPGTAADPELPHLTWQVTLALSRISMNKEHSSDSKATDTGSVVVASTG